MLRASWPLDPAGGGTWVGVSERGVCAAVMNRNPIPPPPRPAGAVSRGLIVPGLLAGDEGVLESASRMPPFEAWLVEPVVAGVRLVRWVWEGERVERVERVLGEDESAVAVTAGIGDRHVRGRLGQWPCGRVSAAGQDAFHRGRGASGDGTEIACAVWMSRADARTVSVTTVAVEAGRVSMEYEPLGDAADVSGRYTPRPGEPVRVELARG